MNTTLLANFATLLAEVSDREISNDPTLGGRLTLATDGPLTVNWAPFDHINFAARVVLVGITPGKQQAINALLEARKQLLVGADLAVVSAAAKGVASFSGPMRSNLVAQLDHVGVNRLLGIASCSSLFGADAALVHYTSALRHPVFIDGENYSGQPGMTKHPVLRQMMERHLGEEARMLPEALWIPLGPRPTEALLHLAQAGLVERSRVLDGLQHPSGANAERIAYFLGRKSRAALSKKTNPEAIEVAKAGLIGRLALLAVPA